MAKYIVLLRGINVGGHKKVPMAELKKMFAEMGFENVQTLLNSGNVVFDGKKEKEPLLIQKIGKQLESTFGFTVNVMLRSAEEIQQLLALAPFKNTEVDKNTRLYVTFLAEKPSSVLELPYSSPENDFSILQKTDREIFSVLNIKTARSVDAMAFLEKEFGKNVTTRNWNTLVKIAGLTK